MPSQTIKRDLTGIILVMKQAYNCDMSVYQDSFLTNTVNDRITKASLNTISEYQVYLSENSREADLLSRSLSNNHSEFFRNALSFATLEQFVLPSLMKEKGNPKSAGIRVWSAGCSSGEEPYSVAMLLADITSALGTNPSIHIFATDISESTLESAKLGQYGYEAVKNVRLQHLQKYFTATGDTYTIKPSLRSRVSISYFDLLDTRSACPIDSIYGEFNLILCCNLLYYYQPEIQQSILNKLFQCLTEGGYLMMGETESAIVAKMNGLREVLPLVPIYQKCGPER